MLKCKLYLVVLLIALSEALPAQQKKQAEYSIPFQLTEYNNISVQAILNKKDTLQLMFHTAANSVMLTEDGVKKLKSMVFDRTDTVKSWGGGGNASRYSKINSLQIGALTFDSVPIWEDKNSGQHTDGKFGPNLFAGKVLEIDFEENVIRLYASLPRKIKKYQKLKLAFENDMMFLEAICETGKGSYPNRYLIHSGYAGAVLFDDRFVSDNKLAEQLTVVAEKQMTDSYGHVLKTKNVVLPAFIIGHEKLLNMPAGFFEGAIGRHKMSIVGGDVLKRFNIIIDAQRQYIYLKANKLKRTGYLNV